MLLLIKSSLKLYRTSDGIRGEIGIYRDPCKLVVLVPTMGNLHEGHLSLIRRARKIARDNGTVVVSVFINKTQFGPGEDFESYPRTLERDTALCREAGADILFAPRDKTIYAAGHSTFVVESRLAKRMAACSSMGRLRSIPTSAPPRLAKPMAISPVPQHKSSPVSPSLKFARTTTRRFQTRCSPRLWMSLTRSYRTAIEPNNWSTFCV